MPPDPKNQEKDFAKWLKLKPDLDARPIASTFYVQVGEIWWCSLGENTGSEINGKNDKFDRPVLIVRVFNKEHVWVVPLTSTTAEDRFHISIPSFYPRSTALISQMRTVSSRRFGRFVVRMPESEMIRVMNALIVLLKNETPAFGRGISTPPLTAGNNGVSIASTENNAIEKTE